MKTIVPEYYLKFHCIADRCQYNCCKAGWEIELDDAAAVRYRELCVNNSEHISKRLSSGIYLPSAKMRKEGERPRILMQENGICPFLNLENLCDLILLYGENGICQICRDHPRFRNYYKDTTELGIGMCCEEACRLILEAGGKISYLNLDTKEDAIPYHRQQHEMDMVQQIMNTQLDIPDWISYLKNLEQLEEKWSFMLNSLLETGKTVHRERRGNAEEMEAVLEYLRYRHLKDSGPSFVAFSYLLIRTLYENSNEDLSEICRLYSLEIEYSDVNRMNIINRLESHKLT